jgi:hypothetical protein
MRARTLRQVAVTGIGLMGSATLVVSVCAMMALASPAQALQYGGSPWLICANNKEAAEVAARNIPLEPASGATVPAGTPVAFSGESNRALTFNVASSQALLSSPDIDSGTGSQSGSFYKFASTKAAATPRTIYWTASWTFTPEDCESPSTFTTPVRTLIVAPTEAELAATKRQQEEAAAKQKLQEEAAAKKKQEETAATGSVLLNSVSIDVKSGRAAAVKLTCSDVATCVGKVALTASASGGKGKTRHARTESIGIASFSIAAGEGATVQVPLDKTGRALMGAAHGHLSATLTIIRTSFLPNKTQTQRVRLELQKVAKVKGGR